MKRFLVQVCLFFLCFLLLTYVAYYLGIHTYLLPNRDVYESIKESKEKNDKVKTVIIGDSVGKQLFNGAYGDGSDTIKSLAANQAIDLIGQYILLKNYLNTNKNVEKVYMVSNPFTFDNHLSNKFTYNYFLKPFYKSEYIPFFTDKAIHQVQKIPFYNIANFPPVAITFWTPEVNEDTISNRMFLSELSAEYLEKIRDITHSRNIDFQIVSPPIKISRKHEIEALLQTAKTEKYTALFSALFHDYFHQLFYLPDSLYVDGVHFKHPEKFTRLVMQKSF